MKQFKERILHSRKLKRPRTSKSIRNAWMKKSRKTSTNFYKKNNTKKGMRMTFYKTDINKVPETGNFEFRVKGLPSIN